jgi:hypothetical protein
LLLRGEAKEENYEKSKTVRTNAVECAENVGERAKASRKKREERKKSSFALSRVDLNNVLVTNGELSPVSKTKNKERRRGDAREM